MANTPRWLPLNLVVALASSYLGFVGTASAQEADPLVVDDIVYDTLICDGYYGTEGYCGQFNSYVETSGNHKVGSSLQLLVVPESPTMSNVTGFDIYLTQLKNGNLVAIGNGCVAEYEPPIWICTIIPTQVGSFYVVAQATDPSYANRPRIQGVTITQ